MNNTYSEYLQWRHLAASWRQWPQTQSKRPSFTVLSLTVSFIFRWMNRSVSFCKQSDARWIMNTCSALWELWARFSTLWLLWWYIYIRLCDLHTDSLTNDTMQTSLSVPVKDWFCLCWAIYIYFPEKHVQRVWKMYFYMLLHWQTHWLLNRSRLLNHKYMQRRYPNMLFLSA